MIVPALCAFMALCRGTFSLIERIVTITAVFVREICSVVLCGWFSGTATEHVSVITHVEHVRSWFGILTRHLKQKYTYI